MLEEIYHKIYAESEEVCKDDQEVSKQLSLLIENADLEVITQEEFTDLVCRACALGERKGFIAGVRFLAKLICDALC